MAVGMSSFAADGFLNSLRNTSFVVAAIYMKLHVADPGAAGATSPAVETTLKAVTFGAAGAGATGYRQIANTVAVTWVAIAGSEDATHFSLWDALTVGNFLGSGLITANPYIAGDTYNVAIGAATIALAIAQ